jgi:hypothetical protein
METARGKEMVEVFISFADSTSSPHSPKKNVNTFFGFACRGGAGNRTRVLQN